MSHEVLHWLSVYAPAVIFVNLAVGIVGIPVLPEALLVVTGAHVLAGDRSVAGALMAGILGSVVGLTFSYYLGRYGFGAAHRWPWLMRLVRERRVTAAAATCGQLGPASVALAFFAPGARHLAAMGAGVAQMRRRAFLTAASVGASVWAGTLVWIGFAAGPARHGGGFPWWVPVVAWTFMLTAAFRARRACARTL
jgi:membrane protein DedA with SNARE-associated domain